MPVLDSLLMLLAGVLVLLITLTAILWKPLTQRVIPYFVTWWRRDAILEEQTRREQAQRRAAEKEVDALLDDSLVPRNQTEYPRVITTEEDVSNQQSVQNNKR
jgi:hypothetical protein